MDEQRPTGTAYFTEWQAKQTGNGTRPATGAPATAPSGRVNYGRAILAGESTAVAQAVKGTRQATLNTSALKLGRAVAGGHVTEDEATQALLDASVVNGHVSDDGLPAVRRWIAHGLRDGMRYPRDAGEPVSSAATGTGFRDLTELLPDAIPAGIPAQPAPTPAPAGAPVLDLSGYVVDGADWLLALPEKPAPVWGDGDQVLWAQGEALMIAGGPGLGKTTLAGQLVRGRLGLQLNVLGMPVAEGRTLLYLAMDRPQQIGRRLRQQFTSDELVELRGRGRLKLGVGPPPQDVARHPDLLAALCAEAGADTLVVDSLKDAAIGLTDDEVGAGYNRARQLAITAGVQVLELHHLVKRGSDGKAPTTLADVYGSAWLTAGAGSVLLLTGDAGDPLVKAQHLKQPLESWGPAELAHDHSRGVTTVHHQVDVLELLALTGIQTARTAAARMFDTDKPTSAQRERARRKLEALATAGLALKRPGRAGEQAESTYHPAGTSGRALTLED